MIELYPLRFQPRFKERIWGGRVLETRYGKPLPPDVPIGESWEIADRPDDESVIANGPLAGRTLRWLMEQDATAVLGDARAGPGNRFPLLCKILDAREKLSLQVHPPVDPLQPRGEPKTEMWYIAQADPGAELFVGLKRDVTRGAFEHALHTGDVADCFHRIAVKTGDTMFLPSGRVHAIGAGLLIFEIQQNSDTTFRVFDWNRIGLDGKPRDLHIADSLASIDFSDVEPSLVHGRSAGSGPFTVSELIRHPLFDVDFVQARDHAAMGLPARLCIIGVVDGEITLSAPTVSESLAAGDFCLLPASLENVALSAAPGAALLVVHPG